MDELMGQRMPSSEEAEQSVIGSVLIDPRCMTEIVSILNAEDFYSDRNRDIYEVLVHMFINAKTIDIVTVLDRLKQDGHAREDDQEYIRKLLEITPTSAHALKYAGIVRDQALLRRIINVGNDLIDTASAGEGEATDVLDYAESKIFELRQGRVVGGLIKAEQIVQDTYENISALATEGKAVPGITTGLKDLDRRIMGLNKSDLIIIAARPGMGKTSLALNMAMAAAKETGKTVAIFSLEMSREQLVTRLLSAESFVNLGKLFTGYGLNEDDWVELAHAAGVIANTDIRVNDNPSLTVADMNAQCRRLPNLGLVVIDYLQLMQSAGSGHSWSNESRTQAVSDMSRMLKLMAKELNVPVICLSQLSRANEKREDKRPVLSDLRESGSIEQDADIVMGIYREAVYNKECENPHEAECIVLKNRHGEIGTEYMHWVGENTSFRDRANDERYGA